MSIITNFDWEALFQNDAMSTFISRVMFLGAISVRLALSHQEDSMMNDTMTLFFSLSVLIASIVIFQRESLGIDVPTSLGYTLQFLMLGCLFFVLNSNGVGQLPTFLIVDVISTKFKTQTGIIKLLLSISSAATNTLRLPEFFIVAAGSLVPIGAIIINSKERARKNASLQRARSSPIAINRPSIPFKFFDADPEEEEEMLRMRAESIKVDLTKTVSTNRHINSLKDVQVPAAKNISESDLQRAFESKVHEKSEDEPEGKPMLISIESAENSKTTSEKQIEFLLPENKLKPLILDSFLDTPEPYSKSSPHRWNSL